eukprot:m51a1_g5912 hypothetical protein (620) ;mRNA; f:16676-31840
MCAKTTKLGQSWQFPSDHLPVGVEIRVPGWPDALRVASWNTLNTAFMRWIFKDEQGLLGSLITTANVPSSDPHFVPLTQREAIVVGMIEHMLFGGGCAHDVVCLQESADLSGQLSLTGQEMHRGLLAAFSAVNLYSLIEFKLLTLDDKYDPATAAENSRMFGSMNIFGLAGGVVNVRPGYTDEISAIISFISTDWHALNSLAVFHQNDSVFGGDASEQHLLSVVAYDVEEGWPSHTPLYVADHNATVEDTVSYFSTSLAQSTRLSLWRVPGGTWIRNMADWVSDNRTSVAVRAAGAPYSTVPAGWTCPSSSYKDGAVCDCECGLWDPDCSTSGAGPLGCELRSFGSGDGCQCGCGGLLDPDCRESTEAGAWYPRALNCPSSSVCKCSDSGQCEVAWKTCPATAFQDGTVCNCDCQTGGVLDPDCSANGKEIDCAAGLSCVEGACRKLAAPASGGVNVFIICVVGVPVGSALVAMASISTALLYVWRRTRRDAHRAEGANFPRELTDVKNSRNSIPPVYGWSWSLARPVIEDADTEITQLDSVSMMEASIEELSDVNTMYPFSPGTVALDEPQHLHAEPSELASKLVFLFIKCIMLKIKVCSPSDERQHMREVLVSELLQ